MTENRTRPAKSSPAAPLFGVQRRLQRVFGKRGQSVTSGTTRVQSVTPPAPGKRGPLRTFLRSAVQSLLLATAMFCTIGFGHHAYLEHSRGHIERAPYDGWSQSVYSQELSAWQQDNQRVSPRYTIAIIDVDQFRDPAMSEDEKRAEYRRQVAAMLPAPVYERMRADGTLDNAFEAVMEDRGTAHLHRELAFSFDPVFSSTGRFTPTSRANFDSAVNVFMTESYAIVVSTDGLRTADQRLRSFAALRDAGWGFDVAGTGAMARQWVVAHEVGHAHDSNAGTSDPHEDTTGERMADAFAALDHIQRFGPQSGFVDAVADARALGAVRGSLSHYTSPAVREAAQIGRDLHALGRLQRMGRAELIELSAEIAQRHEVSPEDHEKLLSLSRLMRGNDSDDAESDGFYPVHNLNPEKMLADLEKWAEHPFFSTTDEIDQLRDILREAFALRIKPANELRPEARPAHQLRELMAERGTSPALRDAILEHARTEANRMEFSGRSDPEARIAIAERRAAIDAIRLSLQNRRDMPTPGM